MQNTAQNSPTAIPQNAGAPNEPQPAPTAKRSEAAPPATFVPTDIALHNDFIRYGGYARHYTRKCLGLLPEIYRRRIYQKRGFPTIFEYARKLAGLSDAQAKRVLSLEQSLALCPNLHKMLTSGKEGISKLARVASIATPQNDEELARKVKLLPKSALEILVQDEQASQKEHLQKFPFGQTFVVQSTGEIISSPGQIQNFGKNIIPSKSQNSPYASYGESGVYGLPKPLNMGENFVPGHKSELYQNFSGGQIGSQSAPATGSYLPSAKIEELYLTEEVKERLLNLQKKGININDLLLELLEARGRELEEEKEALAEKLKEKATRKVDKTNNPGTSMNPPDTHANPHATSRYIPAAIRHHLSKEHGEKCSIETCTRRAQNIHHTQRFALSKSHHPRYLAPLCLEHHKIAHAVDHQYHTAAKSGYT